MGKVPIDTRFLLSAYSLNGGVGRQKTEDRRQALWLRSEVGLGEVPPPTLWGGAPPTRPHVVYGDHPMLRTPSGAGHCGARPAGWRVVLHTAMLPVSRNVRGVCSGRHRDPLVRARFAHAHRIHLATHALQLHEHLRETRALRRQFCRQLRRTAAAKAKWSAPAHSSTVNPRCPWSAGVASLKPRARASAVTVGASTRAAAAGGGARRSTSLPLAAISTIVAPKARPRAFIASSKDASAKAARSTEAECTTWMEAGSTGACASPLRGLPAEAPLPSSSK